MEDIHINLNGEFVNHKTFGRGQIVEQGIDLVTVLFSETKERKKFIYPAAIEAFLILENTATAKQYNDHLAKQKAAAEKLMLEKLALQREAEAPKPTTKKPARKTAKKAVTSS